MKIYKKSNSKLINNQKAKDCYRKLCDEENDIPLFMQAWWMDAVCENKNWDILFYKKDDIILGVLTYYYVKKFGFTLIIQPQLTQFSGIWVNKARNLSNSEIIRLENEATTHLVYQLEKLKFSYFDQNFHHSITNWLPFYWANYEQTTRYTYQIFDISNPENCFKQFKPSKKSHISKAKKTIKINLEVSGKEFYKHLKCNLNSLGKNVYYSEELFLRLFDACMSRNQGCVISAIDNQLNLHAALFIVWDERCAYNLISTINPQLRSSGASSLVFWEAIKLMSSKSKMFDFEGSMNKNIENSFRQFGAVQVPYFRIKKYNSLSFNFFFNIKKWL